MDDYDDLDGLEDGEEHDEEDGCRCEQCVANRENPVLTVTYGKRRNKWGSLLLAGTSTKGKTSCWQLVFEGFDLRTTGVMAVEILMENATAERWRMYSLLLRKIGFSFDYDEATDTVAFTGDTYWQPYYAVLLNALRYSWADETFVDQFIHIASRPGGGMTHDKLWSLFVMLQQGVQYPDSCFDGFLPWSLSVLPTQSLDKLFTTAERAAECYGPRRGSEAAFVMEKHEAIAQNLYKLSSTYSAPFYREHNEYVDGIRRAKTFEDVERLSERHGNFLREYKI